MTVGGERNPVLAVGGASHSGRLPTPNATGSAAAGSSTPAILVRFLDIANGWPIPGRRRNRRLQLDDETMRRVARWTNLSETTFVPSADRSRRRIRRPHRHAGRGAARCRPPDAWQVPSDETWPNRSNTCKRNYMPICVDQRRAVHGDETVVGAAGGDVVAGEVVVDEPGGAVGLAQHAVGGFVDGAARGVAFLERCGLLGREVADALAVYRLGRSRPAPAWGVVAGW